MRYFKRNERTSQWTLHILLALVGLLMVASVPVQSQQAGRGRPPARKCTLPEEELGSLTTLLDDIERVPQDIASEEDPEGTQEESEEAVESGAPQLDPQCTRELKRLRFTVGHLQRSYLELKQSTTTIDEREYNRMDNRYKQSKQRLTAQLDELTKQIKPQHQTQLNELRGKITAVQQQLSATVSHLAEQRQQNVNHLIELVANKIRDRRTSVAITNFNTLATYSSDPYGAIVQKVFQTGNVQTTANVLTFLQKVDFKHRPVLGYDALVDTLIARSALKGKDAIDLLKHLQCIILARDGNQHAEALALMKKFKSNAH